MKISILCDSLLLKKSLEIFLKDYLTTYKNADFVLCDEKMDIDKPSFVVGTSDSADIKVPFSKSSLLADLRRLNDKKISQQDSKKRTPLKENNELWLLEREIDKLTLKFREDLIKIVREYYEK